MVSTVKILHLINTLIIYYFSKVGIIAVGTTCYSINMLLG